MNLLMTNYFVCVGFSAKSSGISCMSYLSAHVACCAVISKISAPTGRSVAQSKQIFATFGTELESCRAHESRHVSFSPLQKCERNEDIDLTNLMCRWSPGILSACFTRLIWKNVANWVRSMNFRFFVLLGLRAVSFCSKLHFFTCGHWRRDGFRSQEVTICWRNYYSRASSL